MKYKQLVFVDTETTGLSPIDHEIIEVGYLRAIEWQDAGGSLFIKSLDSFAAKIHPERLERANPIALEINGYSPEAWSEAFLPHEILPRVATGLSAVGDDAQKTNTAILVGHNVHFDSSFLAKTFDRYNIPFTLNRRAIDTYSVALRLLGKKPGESFSLESLCARFGITNSAPHTAMGDVLAVYELYKKLFEIEESTQEPLF